MRWPSRWRNPSALTLLKGTNINCLLIEPNSLRESLLAEARRNGIRVIEAVSQAEDITIVQGLWPGVRMSRSGDRDEASSGPTGLPWVDSNGWKVRLAAALHPQSALWVDVQTEAPPPGSYTLCFADAAACGGRWIISLDDQLTAGIGRGDRQALETWKALARATNFFAAHEYWANYTGEAVVGVISDFSGENEFLSQELLNLLTRSTEQYRIISKTGFSASCLSNLKAVLYPDSDPPAPELRKQVLEFVQGGGLLVTTPRWGGTPGSFAGGAGWEHPRYICRTLGTGKVAIAKSDVPDPYLLANDTVALISHRFDLLRFWDAGAVNAYLSVASNRRRAVVQMLFYAREMNTKVAIGGPDTATIRVAGRYGNARLLTFDRSIQLSKLDDAAKDSVGMEIGKEAVELHLPPLSHYAAIELSA